MQPLQTRPSFDLAQVVDTSDEVDKVRGKGRRIEQDGEDEDEGDIHQSSHEYDPPEALVRLQTAPTLTRGRDVWPVAAGAAATGDGIVGVGRKATRVDSMGHGVAEERELEMPPPAQLQRRGTVVVGGDEPMDVDGGQVLARSAAKPKSPLGPLRTVTVSNERLDDDDDDDEIDLDPLDDFDQQLGDGSFRSDGGEDIFEFDDLPDRMALDADDERSTDIVNETDPDFEFRMLQEEVGGSASQAHDTTQDAPDTEDYFAGTEGPVWDRALAEMEFEIDRGWVYFTWLPYLRVHAYVVLVRRPATGDPSLCRSTSPPRPAQLQFPLQGPRRELLLRLGHPELLRASSNLHQDAGRARRSRFRGRSRSHPTPRRFWPCLARGRRRRGGRGWG